MFQENTGMKKEGGVENEEKNTESRKESYLALL